MSEPDGALGAADRGPAVGLIRAICIGFGVIGAAAVVATVAGTDRPFSNPALFLCFVSGMAILQVMPLRFAHEGQGEIIFMEEAFFVPMALVLTPAETLVAMASAVAFGHVCHRKGWMKTAFNVGQVVVTAGIGLAVTRALGVGVGVDVDGHSIAAVVLGGALYDNLGTVAVAGVISISQRTSFRQVYMDGAMVRMATYVGALSLGVLVAAATGDHAWVLPVVMIPIAMFQLVYGRALGEWRERQRIELLYEAASAIRGSMDTQLVQEQLLASARTLLEASQASLVHSSEAARDAIAAEIDDDLVIQVQGRICGGRWSGGDSNLLRALAGVASGALRNANLYEQLRTITASLGEGVIAMDNRGVITFANPAAQRMLAQPLNGIVGRQIHDVAHARQGDLCPSADRCRLMVVLASGKTARDDDDAFTQANGSLLPVARTTSAVVREGQIVGAVMVFRDITERKAFEEELAHQAFHDGLTGLSNRALFVDRLAQAQARTSRSGAVYGLLFVDLDRFKVVNDSLGHQAGDELLLRVADRLRMCVRPGDTLARFGGDEFVMLLEDLAAPDDAEAVAQRVLEDLAAPFQIQGRDIHVTASIGVVVGDPNHLNPDQCLRDADVAMYRAKANGKACYEVFRPGNEDAERERLDLEVALRNGIENGELELHYQPVVALETVSVVKLEALVRWRHPQRGLLAPAEFIPLAEETGLILPLGRWVLEEACRQLQAWQRSNPALSTLVVAVNLSARQFRQPDLCEQVAEVLATSGLDAANLVFEVTESVMMDDTESATLIMHKLKDLGIGLAIDDFGTGYSSLSYLKKFPVDFVKIDKSFISDLGGGEVDNEIVRAVIRLSSAVGMRAVAEGVEEEKQLRLLRDLGCPLVQGYYLSPPQPAHKTEALLAERTLRAEAGVRPQPARLLLSQL